MGTDSSIEDDASNNVSPLPEESLEVFPMEGYTHSKAGDTECHIWNIDTDVLVYSSEGEKVPAVSEEEKACQVTLEKDQAEDSTHDECVEQFVDMPDRGNQLTITFDFIEAYKANKPELLGQPPRSLCNSELI